VHTIFWTAARHTIRGGQFPITSGAGRPVLASRHPLEDGSRTERRGSHAAPTCCRGRLERSAIFIGLLLPSLVLPAVLAAFLRPVLRIAVLHALLYTLCSAGMRAVRAIVLSEGRMVGAKCGCFLATAVVMLAAAGSAEAARLRYHYSPADDRGTM